MGLGASPQAVWHRWTVRRRYEATTVVTGATAHVLWIHACRRRRRCCKLFRQPSSLLTWPAGMQSLYIPEDLPISVQDMELAIEKSWRRSILRQSPTGYDERWTHIGWLATFPSFLNAGECRGTGDKSAPALTPMPLATARTRHARKRGVIGSDKNGDCGKAR
ncbi:hypothetical protein M440DRAFT_145207 [Trichoderma longibrachiatum ATCC 18648]|uniref:Uncharacterized protein n=1 Tax=Trichoderma longibrachiatum ATCC 18648 TaxID=983965 RepID=A0A2T4BV93_TRILO|nr:hypothetical protein M440DRAFT_145207 [Trichoderma longibrachiatum ATCC 18648]